VQVTTGQQLCNTPIHNHDLFNRATRHQQKLSFHQKQFKKVSTFQLHTFQSVFSGLFSRSIGFVFCKLHTIKEHSSSPSLVLCRHIHMYTFASTLCSEKNTHSHFLSYLHEWCVDLNKNCSEYTQGMVDSTMYKLDIHCGRWRHYDVTFVWLKLERVYSTQ